MIKLTFDEIHALIAYHESQIRGLDLLCENQGNEEGALYPPSEILADIKKHEDRINELEQEPAYSEVTGRLRNIIGTFEIEVNEENQKRLEDWFNNEM